MRILSLYLSKLSCLFFFLVWYVLFFSFYLNLTWLGFFIFLFYILFFFCIHVILLLLFYVSILRNPIFLTYRKSICTSYRKNISNDEAKCRKMLYVVKFSYTYCIRCTVKLGGFLRMPQNLAKSPSCFDVFTKRLVNVQVNVKTSGRFPKKCPEDFEEEGIS